MAHLLPSFTESIDLSKLRVINFPSLIFLCGGNIDTQGQVYHSARHFMYDYLKDHLNDIYRRIILAETINDWFRGDLYKDLMSFEKDMAGLASAIVLFVESPGSIAELGAFSNISEINEKLIIFISTDNYENESFIRLGPITYLEKSFNSVHVYPWETRKDKDKVYLKAETIKKYVVDIADAIQEKCNIRHKEKSFNSRNSGHIILLICDVIDVMRIVKTGEIYSFLDGLRIEINEKDLQRYLFILQKLNFIKKVAYSRDRYYISQNPKNFIRYSFTEGARTRDILRWKTDFRNWYETYDTRRIRALRSVRSEDDEAQ